MLSTSIKSDLCKKKLKQINKLDIMQLNCNNVLFKLLKAGPQKIFSVLKAFKDLTC